jgi:hypothetical protein
MAIKNLEDALQSAENDGNTYAAFLARNTLGAALVYRGEVKRGLALLDSQTAADRVSGVGGQQAGSPLQEFSRLRVLAIAYQSAHMTDEAIKSWTVLLDKGKNVGNQYIIGEASQKLGDIYRDKHDLETAGVYYRTAADSFRTVGNKAALAQVTLLEMAIEESSTPSARLRQIYDDFLSLIAEDKSLLRIILVRHKRSSKTRLVCFKWNPK